MRKHTKPWERERWVREWRRSKLSARDFCAEHGIVADIELIRADEINTAYERMLKGDVQYRFVIDIATLAESAGA